VDETGSDVLALFSAGAIGDYVAVHDVAFSEFREVYDLLHPLPPHQKNGLSFPENTASSIPAHTPVAEALPLMKSIDVMGVYFPPLFVK